MKTRSSTTCCLLFLLALPAWGQSTPTSSGGAGGEAHRPLNLSLPRDVLAQPATVIRNDADENVTRNLRQEDEGSDRRRTHQRYGTGYEARQRGGSMDSPMGGGGGMGGGGRGGKGRGR